MLIKAEIKIDDSVSYTDIIESWKNGNKSDVIRKLANDHAGLTALVLVQGSQDRLLTLSDCNEITNRLIDARRETVVELNPDGCVYPDLDWVKEHLPTAIRAWGVAQPSHGAMIVAVQMSGPCETNAITPRFNGQPVHFQYVNRKPDDDADFGAPVPLM
jgi:hypothetical protein